MLVNRQEVTAGIPGSGQVEDNGLFGSIATPKPGTLTLLGSGLASLMDYGWRKGRACSLSDQEQ